MSAFDEPTREIRTSLEVIDATMAGEPVAPVHAELAELALLLAGERPAIDPKFAQALDQTVQRRFAPVPSSPQPSVGAVGRVLRARWWLWTPAAGLAAALVAAVVMVAGGFGSSASSTSSRVMSAAKGAPGPAVPLSAAPGTRSAARSPASARAAPTGAAPAGGAGASAAVPLPNGRKTIQGGQLALSTPPARLEQVAQEVFVVVGQAGGIVESSNVTANGGPGGYAQFQLSLPGPALPQAMASLSALRYAKVASRTDTTQDVTNQYQANVRALGDARALRTSLLKQLAGATTQSQIDSLTARIHDAEASISSDEATLHDLERKVNLSQVGLTIDGGGPPQPVVSHGGGAFGLGQAAHDAGRVLTVAAGIALIALAALVPVGMIVALLWWIVSVLRRRRREQALDLA